MRTDVHDRGTSHNAVRVFSTENITADVTQSPAPISTIEPFGGVFHTNVLSAQRPVPIAATAFHPHRMMLACSSLSDGHISMYKCAPRDGLHVVNGANGSGEAGHVKVVKDWDDL